MPLFWRKTQQPFQRLVLSTLICSKQVRNLLPHQEKVKGDSKEVKKAMEQLKDVPFSHLHNKTQFSVLQSTIQVNNLIQKAVDDGMPAVAISDTGNMMAAFHFMETAFKHNSAIDKEINALKEEESEKEKKRH